MIRILSVVCVVFLMLCVGNVQADVLTEEDITITGVNKDYSESHVKLFWTREDLKLKGARPILYEVHAAFPKNDFKEFGGNFTPLERVLYLENQ
ncbi:hypothetical protein IID24_02755 [Patescibacteria group bacterium]|nr:hypothetical protein [Patescibacteria group bacterium]